MEWKKLNNKQQKNLIRLGLLALLGVALLLAGGRTDTTNLQEQRVEAGNGGNLVTAQSTSAVATLEEQLAQTLSCIKGAGTVTVQITVYDLGQKEYARDVQRTERNSQEETGESKQQTTELQESQTVVQQSGQTGGALVVAETLPEIRGVLIVADGANQAVVQEQLLQAAATVLQLSTEKIVVLPGEGARDYE